MWNRSKAQTFKGCDHGFNHTRSKGSAQKAWVLMAAFLKENFFMNDQRGLS